MKKKQIKKIKDRLEGVEYEAHNAHCGVMSVRREMRREIAILHERLDVHARVVAHLLMATGALAILDAKIKDAIDACEKTGENEKEAKRTLKSLSSLQTDIDKMRGDACQQTPLL